MTPAVWRENSYFILAENTKPFQFGVSALGRRDHLVWTGTVCNKRKEKRKAMDGGRAVSKLQGEDTLPQGGIEDQDKSSYFSLSSHHAARPNTNWDCSKRPATVCRWLRGLPPWWSVCLTARGRGLTVLLHRQGRLNESERGSER